MVYVKRKLQLDVVIVSLMGLSDSRVISEITLLSLNGNCDEMMTRWWRF
jgi:hypothetical protein